MFERASVHVARRRPRHHRGLAGGLEPSPAAQLARPPDPERVCHPASGSTDRRRSRLLWLSTVSEGGQRHYPGWYSGRTAHIHVRIRTILPMRCQYEFTSQLYFDEAATDAVHMQPSYAKRGRRTTLNHMDRIFGQADDQFLREADVGCRFHECLRIGSKVYARPVWFN